MDTNRHEGEKEEATTDDTDPSLPITEIFESGKEESRKGISEIEDKGAIGSAERALAVSEFQ
jgi:hypothetical protein